MYVCTECWNESLTWKWQCDYCKAWNTLKEFKEPKSKWAKWVSGEAQVLWSISDLNKENDTIKVITKSWEFNTVLGGGLVEWSIVLLSGEPGIWKSTLSLQLGWWIKEDIIYISGEETLSQISARSKRLWVEWKNIGLLTENNLENILATLAKNTPKIVILDSISVMFSNEVNGTAWSISQVRYITEKVVEYGKQNNITFIIIGHVTKDGSLAGPKTLEHMVDTVLFFEGDKFDNLRILRNLKNRFGSSSEIGLYKMWENWLIDISNPGLEFISDETDTVGSALSVTMEWTRPLVIETEALTTYSKFWYPKRSSRGINTSKLDLIIAVLWKYTPVKLENYDVYANISRWLSFSEPGLDLAIAASIISSKLWKALSKKTIFIWEISLTWKVKKVMFLERRVKEAIKMWFTEIYVPDSWGNLTSLLPKWWIIEVKSIKDFIKYYS